MSLVDTNMLMKALGGDGRIDFETADEKGFIVVKDGRGYVHCAYRRAISTKAVTRWLEEQEKERLREEADCPSWCSDIIIHP